MHKNLESVPLWDTFPRKSLYLLAAPSTPEAARKEVVERAAAGEAFSHGDIAAIIEEHGEGAVLRAVPSGGVDAETPEASAEARKAQYAVLDGDGAGDQPDPAAADAKSGEIDAMIDAASAAQDGDDTESEKRTAENAVRTFRRKDGRVDRRLERFMGGVKSLLISCEDTGDIELPPQLSAQLAAELLEDTKGATEGLRKLRAKLVARAATVPGSDDDVGARALTAIKLIIARAFDRWLERLNLAEVADVDRFVHDKLQDRKDALFGDQICSSSAPASLH